MPCVVPIRAKRRSTRVVNGVSHTAARILQISDERLRSLLEPVKLCEFRHRAERPRYTPLRCLVSERIRLAALRDWRESLAEYICEGGAL